MAGLKMSWKEKKMIEYLLILTVVNTLLIILTLLKTEAGKDD